MNSQTLGTPRIAIYGAFFHEGDGPYLKRENPPVPSSISNTRLIDGVPPLSANKLLKFIRIIYMDQAHKSNIRAAPPSTSTRASAAGDDDCRVPGRKVKATRADGHDPLLCTSRLLEPDDGDHDRCYQFTHFLASLSSRDRSGCY